MRIFISILVVVTGSGCAPVAPQLDSRFGASVRSLMAQQALPAQARVGGDAFDAAAAHGALSQYRQSFQAPAPVPQVSFGTAGGASAGK
jgi:cytochrome c556